MRTPLSCSVPPRGLTLFRPGAHGRHPVLETPAQYFDRLLLGLGRRLGELAHVGERFLESLPGDFSAPSRDGFVARLGGDRLHGFLENLGLSRHQVSPTRHMPND